LPKMLNRSAESVCERTTLSPSGLIRFPLLPMAYAVGCILARFAASSPWYKCRFHAQVMKPVDVRRAGVGDTSRAHIQTIASSIRGHRALRRAPSATARPEVPVECQPPRGAASRDQD